MDGLQYLEEAYQGENPYPGLSGPQRTKIGLLLPSRLIAALRADSCLGPSRVGQHIGDARGFAIFLRTVGQPYTRATSLHPDSTTLRSRVEAVQEATQILFSTGSCEAFDVSLGGTLPIGRARYVSPV